MPITRRLDIRRLPSTTSGVSASSAARHQDIPSITGSLASRPPPARSARASPRASAWPSPQKWLANRYNQPGFDIFDYNIYAVCGDGCMMEGVASEAASLAGHLGLDNLCWVYDNNHITIEGNTTHHLHRGCRRPFLAYGWNVLRVGDANDIDRIEHALARFRKTKGRPRSSSSTATSATARRTSRTPPAAHGEPLGDDEIRLTKRSLRLARGRKVSRARRRIRALRCRHRHARRRGPQDMD